MIIGVDEAGRGPLAGPVVAAAVILCKGGITGLDDSKKLSPTRRAALEAEIKARCHWAVGEASVEEIDRLNILQATMLAMTRAVDAFLSLSLTRLSREGGNPTPDGASSSLRELDPRLRRDDEIGVWEEEQLLILVDGNRLPKWRYPARAIIGGDALEPCISAASIIAKEHRDRIMIAADAAHPGYGFAAHKGYGSQAHRDAIACLGPCPIHRMSFAPMRQMALF
jgi:ribonuclease HII